MSTPKDLSIFSQWLEQKLKEYFGKKSRLDSNWIFSESKSPPIEAAFLDFRILDLKLEIDRVEHSIASAGNQFDDNQNEFHKLNEIILRMPCSKTDYNDEEPYKQGNSRVHLVYQKGCQFIGKDLHLHIYAAEIDDLEMASHIPKYILSLDEHEIDVYTRLFPMLKNWAKSLGVFANFPVPECYFGSYETEKSNSSTDPSNERFDEENLFLVDVMSKVRAGLEYEEKLRRRSKIKGDDKVKQSSYRLLVLDDICRLGFKTRNVCGSTFLSLLNVEACLRSLADIHAISWAFSQVTTRSFSRTWPFLVHPLYLPYVCDQVIPGYFSMIKLVREYLMEGKGENNPCGRTCEERQRIMRHLIKLRLRLEEILERSQRPRTIKCLIHQDPSHSNLFFRYSMLNTLGDDGHSNLNKKSWGNDQVESLGERRRKVGDFQEPPKTEKSSLQQKGLQREVMIINWRTCSFGSPMIDVAFLLLTALPPKTRRAETESLLKMYWNTFKDLAKKFCLTLEWSDEELYEDYLESLLYTCVLIMGNAKESSRMGESGMETFLEAINDLINDGVM